MSSTGAIPEGGTSRFGKAGAWLRKRFLPAARMQVAASVAQRRAMFGLLEFVSGQ